MINDCAAAGECETLPAQCPLGSCSSAAALSPRHRPRVHTCHVACANGSSYLATVFPSLLIAVMGCGRANRCRTHGAPRSALRLFLHSMLALLTHCRACAMQRARGASVKQLGHRLLAVNAADGLCQQGRHRQLRARSGACLPFAARGHERERTWMTLVFVRTLGFRGMVLHTTTSSSTERVMRSDAGPENSPCEANANTRRAGA